MSADMRRATTTLGDRWTLLILWATYKGVSRFDEYQRTLGIARNILSLRLSRLVDAGLLKKAPVQAGARRLGYYLTVEGREISTLLQLVEDYADRQAVAA